MLLVGGSNSIADNSNLSRAARNAIQSENARVNAAPAVRDTATGTAPTSGTINQGADQGRKSQGAGQMMNMIASAALFASCFASCPKCRMELCAMGAMAAAQGAHQGQASNQSDMAFDASEFNSGQNSYDNKGNPLKPAAVDGTGTAGYSSPIIKEGMGKLEESGYKVTEQGVTYPDGSFKPNSAFDSPGSMIAAGIDPATAQAAGEVLGVINEELGSGANVAAMPVDAGAGGAGGGGGYGGGSDFGDMDSFKLPTMRNPFANQDQKKMLAGKSVMVDGEPIGVKGDNIFDMVHRAYQKKRTKQLFIETSKNPARLPASMVSGKGGS